MLGSILKPSTPGQMSFLDHVEALRWHLVRSVVVILTMAIVLFIYHDFVFGTIIFGPKKPDFITYRAFCKLSHILGMGEILCMPAPEVNLVNTAISGQFNMHMWISFVGGIIISSPYILWELWRFIKPALKQKELSYVRGFVFFSSILFFAGVLFSYFIITPLTVSFFAGYEVSGKDVVNLPSLDSYISTVTTLTLLSGIVFELPILVYFLTAFGILTPAFMRQYRKHAVVVILLLAAVITPSSDPFTQLVVAVPIWVLYELSIFVSYYVSGKQQKSSI
jgi:sec-independent protein translocase protein TatC